MEKNLIDIIWPFYKDKKFIKNAIKQINNQTLQPSRIIFIDDNNNDKNLIKLIKEKLNKNIKLLYIKNTNNLGVTQSISIGLKNVKSKYVYIQSTDDIIYSNFLKSNINVLNKNKKGAFVFSNICINNTIGSNKYRIKLNFIDEGYSNQKKINFYFKNYLFKIYHNTVIFRSKNILKFNLFKNIYGRRADMLNLLYLSMRYGFLYHNKFLSEFTIRKNQLSSKILDNNFLFNELIILKNKQKKFFNFFISNNLHYEISPIFLFKSNIFNKYKLMNLKYFNRYIKFNLWKKIRFILNPKLLNFFFKLFK